jgi:hypothetical protein
MYKLIGLALSVMLLGAASELFAQEGFLRASEAAWKQRQARQQEIDRDLIRVEQDAARAVAARRSGNKPLPGSRSENIR